MIQSFLIFKIVQLFALNARFSFSAHAAAAPTTATTAGADAASQ
jgi:hypothetical protein